MKKITLILIPILLIFMSPLSTLAFENESVTYDNAVRKISREYHVPEQEIIDLDTNLSKSLASLGDSGKEFTGLKISENIYADLSIDTDTSMKSLLTKATYIDTVTATLNLKNLYGVTIVTLKGVGVFQTNGSTSKPLDAYGSYSGILWSLSSKTATKGPTAYNAYVRVSFSGQLNVGVNSVNVTIQSFQKSCTIYCNAVAKYSASWT